MYEYQIITLYTLKLHNITCQLYRNEAVKKSKQQSKFGDVASIARDSKMSRRLLGFGLQAVESGF